MAKAKWAVLGILGVLVLAAMVAVAVGVWPIRAEPSQPIAFPHDLHSGPGNQIPCMYCHYSADRSPDAGLPSLQTCAGCHLPGGVPLLRADRPGVQQLAVYWERQQPIPWVRIHDLPDHAHFPHMMHVNAGLECRQCHGPVETMREVEQVASLRMGWCIDCHREREVRTDCFICHY